VGVLAVLIGAPAFQVAPEEGPIPRPPPGGASSAPAFGGPGTSGGASTAPVFGGSGTAGGALVPPLNVMRTGGIPAAPPAGASPTPIVLPTPVPTGSAGGGAGRPEQDEWSPRYVGWATEAYPELTAEGMSRMLARQQQAGANVVWIGHNNPGEVNVNGAEPGLSYAVYEASGNPADPRQSHAQAIVAAQERLLQAARAHGLKVVLPIGYQSQMGSFWDAAHPDALRRDSRGEVSRATAVVNASFYAPDYRQDIRQYYEWVRQRFVQPYRDVILMLNLADEPAGGDYSRWAEAEFRARTGYGFADVGENPERVAQLGAFQSGYIADYAAWSAQQWAALEPDLPTTMSFDGLMARVHYHLPQLEAVFARTPATFHPTFDAYPRDGPPSLAIEDPTLVQLFTLVRTLGHYSARYGKPFWLWSTANSWGLGQASPQPADVADAVANGYYLALLARQTGGWLRGIAVWNYNAAGQGLYNDTHRTRYDPDTMFARVSESFPRIRQILAAPPGTARVLVLAPDGWPYRLVGAVRTGDAFALRSYEFHRLAALARNNVPAAVVGRLGDTDLTNVKAIVVLARWPHDLPPADLERLRGYLVAGGTVVAARHLSPLLGPHAHYVEGERPEEAFADPPTTERAALWRRVLGIERPLSQGFLVATGDDALLYNVGRLLQTDTHLPFAGQGWVAGPNGAPLGRLNAESGRVTVALDKNQYAYLSR
jgi:hypothetical protein